MTSLDYKGPIMARFCNMGMVNSKNWFPCYITIEYGVLRVYDDEETIHRNPSNTIMQMVLDHSRRPSNWKRKNYSKVSDKVINFYTFYILKDNAFMDRFMYKRKVKFGSLDMDAAEKLMRCIEANTQNKATEALRPKVL